MVALLFEGVRGQGMSLSSALLGIADSLSGRRVLANCSLTFPVLGKSKGRVRNIGVEYACNDLRGSDGVRQEPDSHGSCLYGVRSEP